jgi:sulfoxide reductase heme-binding subunit YedZ
MTHAYRAVQWNRHKRTYDLLLVAGVLVYIIAFIAISKLTWAVDQAISDEVLIIRATGTLAFLMLHIVLCIGPLARFDRRFLPLLYNRRHFGVMMFLVAFVHAFLTIGFYHGFGVVNPLISLLTSNTNYTSLTAFPFETLGLIALLILFVMAATSHDFWLANLKPGVWKALHMMAYVAYALLVGHVVLGAMQSEHASVYTIVTFAGVALVAGLHLAAGLTESRRPEQPATEWVDAGSLDDLPMDHGKVVRLNHGQRIAVFRHADGVSAVSNVCAHQNGPLGEGRIVDGCITCPWHGYQYRPNDGQSPPPYTEKIPTYRVRLEGKRILVDPNALPPGTAIEPASIGASA